MPAISRDLCVDRDHLRSNHDVTMQPAWACTLTSLPDTPTTILIDIYPLTKIDGVSRSDSLKQPGRVTMVPGLAIEYLC